MNRPAVRLLDRLLTHLAQRELKRAQRDASCLFLTVFRLEPHGVRYHGQEQQRHATRDPLHPREIGARGTREDREPEVVVGQFLPGGGGEQVFEGDKVVDACYREDPVHHPVIFFHS